MREFRLSGSVRGVLSNGHPYREPRSTRAMSCCHVNGRNPRD